MEIKKTVVIGASPNENRYSYKAVKLLSLYSHPVVPIGIRNGSINNIEIIKGFPEIKDVHTVTIYVGTDRQSEYYNYIISLNPKRVIFNPGTENPEFYKILETKNIKVVQNCSLVMLNSDLF
ncbi:MAG: CoA-binding protein [Bacteroidales bacterium]|nr:CoA-binding protein [Bacteroidales bacterium]MBN2757186.1 CoA-binding protein [Bacteroidales bacterium]